jgi:hypothetical protein
MDVSTSVMRRVEESRIAERWQGPGPALVEGSDAISRPAARPADAEEIIRQLEAELEEERDRVEEERALREVI